MAYWLLKTEPSTYSWADLIKEKKTTWNGVTNALALKHIRSMKKGDRAFVYHTGNEKQIIGVAQVISNAKPDPKDAKLAVVEIKPTSRLKNPVTLAVIKSDKIFAGWDLLRNSRLSVMPVPGRMWKRIESVSKENTE
jgi:predicted RNA-binding protein with PUA-like domain